MSAVIADLSHHKRQRPEMAAGDLDKVTMSLGDDMRPFCIRFMRQMALQLRG
jgi:hypothetical protein